MADPVDIDRMISRCQDWGNDDAEEAAWDMCYEIERLRREVAQLDAICRWNCERVATVVDEEFGLRIGGMACEHPSLTGDRCDACGWTRAWDVDQ